MLTKREFYGNDFYAFCKSEFDKARHFLKYCGKPADETDRFLIDDAKFTAKLFGNLLRESL